MIKAMSGPNKPMRLCERVVKFPRIQECDNMEVDSLDGYSASIDHSVSDKPPIFIKKIELKRVMIVIIH